MDGWMDGWMGGWMDGWMDGCCLYFLHGVALHCVRDPRVRNVCSEWGCEAAHAKLTCPVQPSTPSSCLSTIMFEHHHV
eukprot:366446-Chlamydomonas_euryale.AAC.3